MVSTCEKTADYYFAFETIKTSMSNVLDTQYEPETLMSDAAPAIEMHLKMYMVMIKKY